MTFESSAKQINLVTVFVLIGLTLLGCSRQNQSTPYGIPGSILTADPNVSITPVLTHGSANTLPPTLESTFVPSPDPTTFKAMLKQLLMHQELCELPCFWGITPNQTTLDEAQSILNSLGLNLKQTSQEGEPVFYATSFGLENGLVTSIVLRIQDNIVDSTRTNIGFTNFSGSSPLQETLAFSPKTIQSQYGDPTHVEFYISRSPDNGSSPYTISYVMTMYFDVSDLIIEYQSKPIRDEKTIKVCPLTDNFERISVWHGKDAEDAPNREGVSIDNVTSLNAEQFGDMVAGQPDNACFDLNRDLFP